MCRKEVNLMRKRKKRSCGCFFVLALAAVAVVLCCKFLNIPIKEAAKEKITNITEPTAEEKISTFAKKHGLSESEYPKELVELLKKNPETEDFVLNYPLKKDKEISTIFLNTENDGKVPLFMQWDERWGYYEYSDEIMGLSGCGPTCLSMVAVYLTQDTKYNPKYMADFSKENGYSVAGKGSAWSLIYEGGRKLGLDVVEISLDENRVLSNLEVGNPIICIMGPGDFTTSGHFIVLAATENGKIKINDPNSRKNSEKLWEFDEIKDQIQNIWVFRT